MSPKNGPKNLTPKEIGKLLIFAKKNTTNIKNKYKDANQIEVFNLYIGAIL